MAHECEMFQNCGLFKKYQRTDGLGCRWFMERYCSGPRMTECRRRYHLQKGTLPSDDMLPTGTIIASVAETDQMLARS